MKAWIKTTIYISIMLVLIYFLEWYGVWGLLILILAFALYRMYTRRANLISLLRSVETIIWKKPLDKKLWKHKEMKNTQVRITIGKGKYKMSNLMWDILFSAIALLFFLLFLFKSNSYIVRYEFLIISLVSFMISIYFKWRESHDKKSN